MALPVFLETTLAARYGKSAPSKACSPSPKQPSVPTTNGSPFSVAGQATTSSLYVPSVAAEIRRSSSVPRSNSWLPTDETSRPIASSTSMVGSSLKRLDSNGEALIRSPAPTNHEPDFSPLSAVNAAWSPLTVDATLAAPPTMVDDVVRRAVGAVRPRSGDLLRVGTRRVRDASVEVVHGDQLDGNVSYGLRCGVGRHGDADNRGGGRGQGDEKARSAQGALQGHADRGHRSGDAGATSRLVRLHRVRCGGSSRTLTRGPTIAKSQ